MLTKRNVIGILNKEQTYLKENFGVKRMAIFGSFAKGKAKKNSDIDIFVEFSKPVGLGFIDMIDYLEEKLGRKADVLTPGGLKSIRLKNIKRNIKRSLIYV